MTSLSVLVPVYDEEHLVAASLERLLVLEASPFLSRVQVIVVDDCSRDGTPAVLQRFQAERAARPSSKMEWIFLRHATNGGKGKAIQTALAKATCEISVIHDADLEYHPVDLLKIVKVFEEERADAVFGSRFTGSESRRVLFFRHELGNRLLTFITNLVTDLNLSDMETCYKAVRTDLLRSIPIVSNDFRLEPELCIKLAKREARVFEVPIRYSGRTYQEGKKIGWRDGVRALSAIARFAVSDDIYAADEHGSHIVGRIARARRYHGWTADLIRPYCGRRVLEIGSGTGTVTRHLVPRARYVASDMNPLHLQTLSALQTDRPYLHAEYCDITDVAKMPRIEDGFDTVIALNVLGNAEDDVAALRNMRSVLAPGGRAILLVPHGQRLFGSLDEVLGYRRRYSRESLTAAADAAGFRVAKLMPFNRLGSAAWWLNGRVLRRRSFGLGQVLALNALTPVLRRVDRALPLPPVSLIAVLESREAAPAAPRPRRNGAAERARPAPN
jgi:glycosyltransferase involved in cell wall biosynthesis